VTLRMHPETERFPVGFARLSGGDRDGIGHGQIGRKQNRSRLERTPNRGATEHEERWPALASLARQTRDAGAQKQG
jgi:hypothetical protein